MRAVLSSSIRITLVGSEDLGSWVMGSRFSLPSHEGEKILFHHRNALASPPPESNASTLIRAVAIGRNSYANPRCPRAVSTGHDA